MRFLKIKYSNNKMELKFEKENKAGDMDEFSMKCTEKPLPEFEDALQALVPHALEICELPDHPGKYQAISVSLSWTKDIMAATVTIGKALQDTEGALIINTPHKPAKLYGGGAGGDILRPELVMAIKVLQNTAARYVEGHRAQLGLFTADQADDQQEAAVCP